MCKRMAVGCSKRCLGTYTGAGHRTRMETWPEMNWSGRHMSDLHPLYQMQRHEGFILWVK